MRKITQQSLDAFIQNRNFRSANMTIEVTKEATKMKLHSNTIATLSGNELTVSNCGWETPVTKARINSVLSHFNLGYLRIKQFRMYYNEETVPFTVRTFKVN